jgi:prevent-host-death family protein
MEVTATEAKNRLGQMLDHCQREPVVIEKQGRRHSVLISAAHYDALRTAAAAGLASAAAAEPGDAAEAFYARHKEWVDQVNRLVETHGIPGEEFRAW